METTIDGGVGGPVIVDGADGGGRGVARHSDVSIARAARGGRQQDESGNASLGGCKRRTRCGRVNPVVQRPVKYFIK